MKNIFFVFLFLALITSCNNSDKKADSRSSVTGKWRLTNNFVLMDGEADTVEITPTTFEFKKDGSYLYRKTYTNGKDDFTMNGTYDYDEKTKTLVMGGSKKHPEEKDKYEVEFSGKNKMILRISAFNNTVSEEMTLERE